MTDVRHLTARQDFGNIAQVCSQRSRVMVLRSLLFCFMVVLMVVESEYTHCYVSLICYHWLIIQHSIEYSTRKIRDLNIEAGTRELYG